MYFAIEKPGPPFPEVRFQTTELSITELNKTPLVMLIKENRVDIGRKLYLNIYLFLQCLLENCTDRETALMEILN